jgi:hypothetical protein
MSRTVIDLDDALVADAVRALGTTTKTETVNAALREVLENRRRALAPFSCARRLPKGRLTWTCWTTRATSAPCAAAKACPMS